MKYIGVQGARNREGQEVNFYGSTGVMGFDEETNTPYITIKERVEGRMQTLRMPLLPGDEIQAETDNGPVIFQPNRGYKPFGESDFV